MVKGHYRRNPSGGKSWVRSHSRRKPGSKASADLPARFIIAFFVVVLLGYLFFAPR